MRPTYAPPRRRRPVRLTPRGRLFVLVLCLVFSGLLTTLATPSSAVDPPGGREVVLVPGEAAWSVPEWYPGRDPDAPIGGRLDLRTGDTAHAGGWTLPVFE